MKKVLFVSFVLVAVAASGCASAGYTGLTGLSVPGYEAAGVVAANQAMVAAIAGQQGWAPYGQPYGQFGNIPVCRAQDLVGLPPISVSQPVLVRVPKSKGHRAMDALFGAGAGAGAAYFWGSGVDDWRRLAVGSGLGASVGGLAANHEPADYCLLLPVSRP